MVELSLEEMVLENEKLVHYVAKRFRKRADFLKVDYEDLISEGKIGLLKAVKKFDANYGVKFSTYAVPMIEGTLRRFLRDTNPGARFSRPAKELAAKLTGEETVKEIIEKFQVTKWRAEEAIAYRSNNGTFSIDMKLNDHEDKDLTLLDTIGYREDFSNIEVEDFLSWLPPKLSKVVKLTMKDKTQQEIADRIGCSQVHVSRMFKKIRELYQKFHGGGNEEMTKKFTMSADEYVKWLPTKTKREIAKTKGISEATLYNWIKEHEEQINQALRKEEKKIPEPPKQESENDKSQECQSIIDELKEQLKNRDVQLREQVRLNEQLQRKIVNTPVETSAKPIGHDSQIKELSTKLTYAENEIARLREANDKLQGEKNGLITDKYHLDYQVCNQKERIKTIGKTLETLTIENRHLKGLVKLWME